jgi:ribosomal protein L1
MIKIGQSSFVTAKNRTVTVGLTSNLFPSIESKPKRGGNHLVEKAFYSSSTNGLSIQKLLFSPIDHAETPITIYHPRPRSKSILQSQSQHQQQLVPEVPTTRPDNPPPYDSSILRPLEEPRIQLPLRRKHFKYSVSEAIELLIQKVRDPNASFITNIALNVDPTRRMIERRPGHRMHDCMRLPHGTGKPIRVAALCDDDDLAMKAAEAGARYVGNFVASFEQGILTPRSFDRLVCSEEMIDFCIKRRIHPMARILKKYSKQPCFQERTLAPRQEFVDFVYGHAHGLFLPFRNSRRGGVTLLIGKRKTHSHHMVKENLEAVLEHLYAIKPKVRTLSSNC